MSKLLRVQPAGVFVIFIREGKIPSEYTELGVAQHFSPPISPIQIERAVSQFISRAEEEETKRTIIIFNPRKEEAGILNALLKGAGFRVLVHDNLDAALKDAKAYRIDAAVVDMELGEELDCAQVVKALHHISPHLPIVVITDDKNSSRIIEIHDLNISTDLGICAYFIKPIDIGEFRSVMERIVVTESITNKYIVKPAKPLEEGAQVEEEAKIMIVEDSAAMRKIIAKYLGEIGYKNVVEASDGLDAIEKVDSTFSLLIVDWIMPEMDGLQFIRLLKRKPHLTHIPILMVTSQGERDKVIEALASGVDDYIVKPFTADTLKEKVERLLKRRS